MIQPVLANEKLAIPTANKVDAPITAAKHAILADSKNIKYIAQTTTKPISANNIPLESRDIDEDNAGKSEKTNSSDLDIDSSDIEAKKAPSSSDEENLTQDSG
ncbi:hypothetical protein AYI69_g11183 [Smittium culicis]|uniref:Uncharacterized protein n=1 Tax=Smittium culicis TaxID=133412 RepID=A0A1R1X0J0_9FUNG|nr:hypothetical protein AYI69_g11183 [Smittium culicis]